MTSNTKEVIRLEETREGKALWKKWGPYLSERQWKLPGYVKNL